MTDVVFHYGVADKLDYAIRLLRKAVRTGFRVRVALAPAEWANFSARLWAMAPTGFVAHCDDHAPASLKRRSPVLLGTSGVSDEPEVAVLLNLTDDMPEDPQRYEKILEVITTDPQDRQQGRARKRAYDSAHCPVVMHDAGAAQTAGVA
jgi:DNA polymerase-3 subunit chi